MLNRSTASNKRRYLVHGLLLACLFLSQTWKDNRAPVVMSVPEILEQAHATPVATLHSRDSNLKFVSQHPLEFLRQARRNYDRRVHDYRCVFTKQERLGQRLTAMQVSEVKFREGPFSVYLHIVGNASKARRVLYVKDRIIRDGLQYAVIQPEGPIARLLVNSVERPIGGEDAMKSSRKRIDQFGFANSLDLILKFAERAVELGQSPLRYVGEGEIDGRPTYILERRLPYNGDETQWPDCLLIVHLDQEWQLPVACVAYADENRSLLLGKYVYTKVSLNVGLKKSDFNPANCGM